MDDQNIQTNPSSGSTSPSVVDGIGRDMKDFHSMSPNRKLAVLGIIAVALILAIFVGMKLTNKGTSETNTAPSNPNTAAQTATTSLAIVPSSSTATVNGTVKVSVQLSQLPVQATDIAVSFDPKMFIASDIVNGNVYEEILKSEIQDGQVLVSSAVSSSNPQDLRTGELFSFTLKALRAGEGKLSFDKTLTITAKNGVNTLGEAKEDMITVK